MRVTFLLLLGVIALSLMASSADAQSPLASSIFYSSGGTTDLSLTTDDSDSSNSSTTSSASISDLSGDSSLSSDEREDISFDEIREAGLFEDMHEVSNRHGVDRLWESSSDAAARATSSAAVLCFGAFMVAAF